MPSNRKFDYAEAKRLRDEGLSLEAIGKRFHVSAVAIYYALKKDPTSFWSRLGEFKRTLSRKERIDYEIFINKGIKAADAMALVQERRERRAEQNAMDSNPETGACHE